jgi:uncharacterized membrane protein YqjE
LSNKERLKAYTIALIMLIVLTVVSIGLSLGTIINYMRDDEISLAFLISMPVLLCFGSTIAMYRMYKKLKVSNNQ